jgi:hypothetical protein
MSAHRLGRGLPNPKDPKCLERTHDELRLFQYRNTQHYDISINVRGYAQSGKT